MLLISKEIVFRIANQSVPYFLINRIGGWIHAIGKKNTELLSPRSCSTLTAKTSAVAYPFCLCLGGVYIVLNEIPWAVVRHNLAIATGTPPTSQKNVDWDARYGRSSFHSETDWEFRSELCPDKILKSKQSTYRYLAL